MREKWEDDEDWLYRVLGRPSVAEIERFCERVAIMVGNGLSEPTARTEALQALREDRKG